MFWTYLTNSFSSNILTFESFELENDYLINDSIKGYCKLILDDFFSSFSQDWDAIFISTYSPNDMPLLKDNLFYIKFNDLTKAENILGY